MRGKNRVALSLSFKGECVSWVGAHSGPCPVVGKGRGGAGALERGEAHRYCSAWNAGAGL